MKSIVCNSLITRSSISESPSECILRFWGVFFISMSMMSIVSSERAVLLGNVPAGVRTTPPQATDALRIEIRLLRDTRRVLEYLSKEGSSTVSPWILRDRCEIKR